VRVRGGRTPGTDTTGYPLSAIRTLAWDDLYANLYVATAGFLAIAIGAGPFRRGERWAWYAIAVFVLAGAATGLLDYLSWGGWFTFLFLGLPPLLGLALATRRYFPRAQAVPLRGARGQRGAVGIPAEPWPAQPPHAQRPLPPSSR